MRIHVLGWAVAAAASLMVSVAVAGNQEIAQEIANRLRTSGKLSDYNVNIKFEDGTAWLRGRVSHQQQVSEAMAIARSVNGVQRVENELTIEMPQAPLTAMPGQLPGQMQGQMSGPMAAQGVRDSQVNPARYAQPTPVQAPVSLQPPMPMPGPVVQSSAPQGRTQTFPLPRAASYPMPNQMQMQQMQMQQMGMGQMPMQQMGMQQPVPAYGVSMGSHGQAARFDQPHLPGYAWPSYAAYPNYAAVSYPRQYSPSAWPYIGPFYPYPQVPLGWRRVTLEWDDGWWWLDFKDR